MGRFQYSNLHTSIAISFGCYDFVLINKYAVWKNHMNHNHSLSESSDTSISIKFFSISSRRLGSLTFWFSS